MYTLDRCSKSTTMPLLVRDDRHAGRRHFGVLQYGAAMVVILMQHVVVARSELTQRVYNNSAWIAPTTSTTSLTKLEHLTFGESGEPYSAEIEGHVVFDDTKRYAFDCEFREEGGNDTVALLYVGDHLVCHTDPYPFSKNAYMRDGTTSLPLSNITIRGKPMNLLLRIYGSSPFTVSAVRWTTVDTPSADANVSFEVIPAEAFVNISTDPDELRRRELQRHETSGWGLWSSHNILAAVLLPESVYFRHYICRISTNDCLRETHIEDTNAQVRVGRFAADRSFWKYYLSYAGVNVSLSFTGGQSPLRLLVDVVSCERNDCDDYALVVNGQFAWGRAGNVSVADGNRILFEPWGQESVVISATASNSDDDIATRFGGQLAYRLNQSVAFSSLDSDRDIRTVKSAIDNARVNDENIEKARYGDLAEVKEAVTASVMWNQVYVPTEAGPIFPVSRAWNFVHGASNSDWQYVLFDWDNFFASLLASADVRCKNASYSNLIQIVRSRTAKGFVPNYSAGGDKSIDRTEPPIGAIVLKEMYTKFHDDWIVRLLFDDLVAWNDWFVRERTVNPLGIVSLGSDGFVGYTSDKSAGAMQAARFESGLDNSPMYDGDFFVSNVSNLADGPNRVGMMTLYDVGMASMFTQEARALSYLAREVMGRDDEADRLHRRANSQAALIRDHLWHDEDGIFTNKFWNGSFYPRRSPTSFYGMMAKAATDAQADRMVTDWLLSPEHFCISIDGNFTNLTDTCYWGLPSIEASDPAFPPLGYWRGYVWGPMAQLTYWSLREYDTPLIDKARKALCDQMQSLLLSQWRRNRHICENYNPHRTADTSGGDCTGTKFYHWGALTGLIGLMEEGKY